MDDGRVLALISSDPYNVLKLKYLYNKYSLMILVCFVQEYIIINLLTNKSNTSSENKQTVNRAHIDVLLSFFPSETSTVSQQVTE